MAGLLFAVATSCGSAIPSSTDSDGTLQSPDGASPSLDDAAASLDGGLQSLDGSSCNVLVESQPNGGHLHIQDCAPVTYDSNPPSSGTHYPDWAMYKSYAAPVPWGFLVHDLEHGAIVITYNCPDGCLDEVAQAQALIDGLPTDRSCKGAPMRIVLVPDPGLGVNGDADVRWAASAWTWTLRAPCFDRDAFASFITAHYQGPDTEAACGGGVDLSATGWCP